MNNAPSLNKVRRHRFVLLIARRLLLGLLLVWKAGFCVHAQINASATLSSQPAGLNFDYTLTLNNNSPPGTPLDTFWFAWVPGADFLPSSPISVQPPSGWSETVTHGGATDGYGIEFVTSTARLNPGNSLLFQFQSADTPAELAGNSPFYPSTPVGTSYVFDGTASQQFVVQPVPEPSVLGLLLIGYLAYAFRLSRLRAISQLRIRN
jgi:hypothetical protein